MAENLNDSSSDDDSIFITQNTFRKVNQDHSGDDNVFDPLLDDLPLYPNTQQIDELARWVENDL